MTSVHLFCVWISLFLHFFECVSGSSDVRLNFTIDTPKGLIDNVFLEKNVPFLGSSNSIVSKQWVKIDDEEVSQLLSSQEVTWVVAQNCIDSINGWNEIKCGYVNQSYAPRQTVSNQFEDKSYQALVNQVFTLLVSPFKLPFKFQPQNSNDLENEILTTLLGTPQINFFAINQLEIGKFEFH